MEKSKKKFNPKKPHMIIKRDGQTLYVAQEGEVHIINISIELEGARMITLTSE
ncbi:MAG: hypothetical protein GY861_08295 [bacterium]|nr:hypothetical protein [bacterium]